MHLLQTSAVDTFCGNLFRHTLFCLAVCALLHSGHAEVVYVDFMFGVNVATGVQYGTSVNGQGVFLPRLMDVYTPTNIGTPVPTDRPSIVLMHSGSFIGGHEHPAPSLT